MDLRGELERIGLNKTETQVYLFILGNGLSTPPMIARGAKINRTNSYQVLKSLQDKGLLEQQKIRKRKAYLARDPQALLLAIEEKKEIIERIVPDLRALYTVQKNKPNIRFYEGLDGIQELYWQTLSAEKIMGIGSTNNLASLAPAFFTRYQKEIKKRGIIFADILTAASRQKGAPETLAALDALYEVSYLPEKFKDQPTDILIWDNNIALITLQEPIFGTVLTSPLLAQTFRVVFEALRAKYSEDAQER